MEQSRGVTIADDLEGLRVEVDRLHVLPGNPRRGSIEAVARSLDAFGQRKPVVATRDGTIIAGNHTYLAARQLGWSHIAVVWTDDTEEMAKAFALADNRTSDLADYDTEALIAFLRSVEGTEWFEPTGYSADDLLQLLADATVRPGEQEDEYRQLKGSAPSVRQLPIDAIYSMGKNPLDPGSIIGHYAGFLRGARSSEVRPFWAQLQSEFRGFKMEFVDCFWRDFDWSGHLEIVAALQPRYATVRDVMTKAQCEEAGVTYYPLEQVLEWATELSSFARDVIVIPKYDCTDAIPEGFMLGYSVPSSYGATPLRVEAFAGRRTHLLGGSWKAQLAYMAAMRDDVVSIDFNYANNISRWLRWLRTDGSMGQWNDLGLPPVVNPRAICLALSLGNIGMALHQIWPDRAGSPFAVEAAEEGPEPTEEEMYDQR